MKIGDKVIIKQNYNKVDERARKSKQLQVQGRVIDIKEHFFIVQTKNYKECFSFHDIGSKVILQ
ncbi:hypothetical protein Q3V94_00445 [Caloramator sp. CAR-1]|uniref:hypothetical protein n=1 Tax=Caloramator sp. CAR-1 TaxID=3062777 RepID=UPI0026E189D9|nr:hypothetical protein [Caloramator sp. CAR-1]MDO6353552.1 hypothetical protein [Caloramator sp. CAR-1]